MYGVAVKVSDGWQTYIREVLVGFISYNDANEYALEMNNQADENNDDSECSDWAEYFEVIKVKDISK